MTGSRSRPLGKLLLRRGLHYAGRNWTRAPREWINSLTWPHAAERAVVEDYLLAIDHTESRLIELDARLTVIAETAPDKEPVARCADEALAPTWRRPDRTTWGQRLRPWSTDAC